MAFNAQRLGDPNTGGGTIILIPQSTVFTNNILQSINGSLVSNHGDPPHDAAVTANGSTNVLATNIPTNFKGNADTCGDLRDGGSTNVFINAPGGIAGSPVGDVSEIIVDPNVQANVTEFEAGIHLLDDEDDDDGLAIFPGAADVNNPTSTEIQRSIDNGYDPDTPEPAQIDENLVTPPPGTEIPDDCTDIFAQVPPFPGSFPLSTNFTLAALTTNTAISNYSLQAQASLTENEIVCNLRLLCLNILEPILASFGTMFITSGFRHGSGTSQHHKGQAVDIQFTGFSFQDYWDTAQIVKDTILYDSFILELGKTYWFHLSYNEGAQRQQVLTRTKPGVYKPGLIRIV